MEDLERAPLENNKDEDEEIVLPGFRFHPTDEELVGFYLRRKVENKPLRIELIKQVDIYKYDPWDLPKVSTVGEKEWYFFCTRSRKYKNSVRPNRVTGSGFWKATGIDKPIYDSCSPAECIGLKKSLVYYRGSAGKGTKTEWMMHEFRLPPSFNTTISSNHQHTNPKHTPQDASDVWTLCRILKRNNTSHKNHTSQHKLQAMLKAAHEADALSKSCCSESENSNNNHYIILENEEAQNMWYPQNHMDKRIQYFSMSDHVSTPQSSITTSNCSSSFLGQFPGDLLSREDHWDELKPVVELAMHPLKLYNSR